MFEDKYYIESFDGMLEAWTNILQEYQSSTDKLLSNSATQILNTYLQCHLAPPDGMRKSSEDEVEEIEDNEDNDRIKFRDQLQTIGMFGRVVPEHSLAVIHRLVVLQIILINITY